MTEAAAVYNQFGPPPFSLEKYAFLRIRMQQLPLLRRGDAEDHRQAAEKMPADGYDFKPLPEVRTFGQQLGHLANYNYLWCSEAKGEKNPMEETDFEKLSAKADLVKALNSALTYCDGAYAMLTDANSMDMVQGTRDDGTKVPVLRVSRFISNLAHNNEHYGNLVTYMRIKSIVPPSSEPR